jgi:hypothetical protein
MQKIEFIRDLGSFPETIRESVNEEQTFRNPFESNRDICDLRFSIPFDENKKEKVKFSPLGSPIKLSLKFEDNIKKASENLIHKMKCKYL